MFRSNSKRQLQKHVNSVKNHPNLSPSTREVSKGLFDTVFECITGEVLVLRTDFRAEPVIVTLFGCRAQHPLVDSDMHVRIAYHDNKLLGAALMDTIVQMQLNPPMILSFTDDEVRALQPPILRPRSGIDINPVPDPEPSSLTDPEPSSLTTSQSSHRNRVSLLAESSLAESSMAISYPSWNRVGFKDQAQTVVEQGTNTPSADAVIWADALVVDDRMDTTASDPSGTYYTGDVSTFSILS